jgi:hypothetical protein
MFLRNVDHQPANPHCTKTQNFYNNIAKEYFDVAVHDTHNFVCLLVIIIIIIIIRGATDSNEPWPAEQPPLAVFPDCTRRYWVDTWLAHRIPQMHFQL